MDLGWRGYINQTRSGSIELPVELSASSASSLVTGQGSGSHTIKLRGLPRSLLMELSTGNRYSLSIGWADDPAYCAYSGTIQHRRVLDDSGELVIRTRELQAAFFGKRSFFGVNQYDPVSGQIVVTNRSYSGAVRQILAAAMAPSAEWVFPIDLPADGAGGFSKTWKHEEAIPLADMLQVIRDQGNEIDLRPYFSGSQVRHRVRVMPKVTHGAVTDLAVRAPGSVVTGLAREEDWTSQVTGVGAFGNGAGQVRPYAFAPSTGSGAVNTPVMDAFETYPDIEVPEGDVQAQAQLQAAADAYYNDHKGAVESTSFDVNVWGRGPQFLEPGRVLDLWSYGGYAMDDGKTRVRVKGVQFDLSTTVTPEVETYGS